MDEVYICELCLRAYQPKKYPGMYVLKTFKGYTVDLRLRQFSRVTHYEESPSIEFIEFASPKGKALLAQMHEEVMR